MKHTRDLWFTSFLTMNKIQLSNYTIENGKLKFFFDLTDEEWASWRRQFLTSDIAECKMQQEKLKDLLY